ncbi:MAG TPA: hypothetical protein VEQ59_02750 [Polyangiaceae bacterium]|nr:hypothetical protein [Polyangiaceae bacterium]
MELSERFVDELKTEFPAFCIRPKQGDRLSQAIDVALRIVTLGGQRHYLTRYHTVIGDTLYVPETWAGLSDLDRVILLRHERVHLRQRRRYGGALMAFIYLVPFLPLGLAYGRARIEWEAYTETLRATAELRGLDALQSPELREHIVKRFVGPDYGWMWPFRSVVEGWYDRVVRQLLEEPAARRVVGA